MTYSLMTLLAKISFPMAGKVAVRRTDGWNKSLFIVFLLLLPCISFAQSPAPVNLPPEPITGTIVSVRGDIFQINQLYLKGVSRFLATRDTDILDRKSAPLTTLKAGMQVLGSGKRDADGTVFIKQLRASKSLTAFSRWGAQIGLQPDPWRPNTVDFGGTLKSLNPVVILDDSGAQIQAKFSLANLKSVDLWIHATSAQIMIGRKAYVIGSRRSSDILLASQVYLMTSPGNPGTMFGKILSIKDGKVSVLPRFALDPIIVSLASGVKIERQLPVDPDSIRLGQTVTIWGGHSADSDDLSQLTAYVVMPGAGHFPGSVDISEDDPTAAGRDIVGRIIRFDPMVIKTSAAKSYIVSIPGQTPTATYKPATLSDLHSGEQGMLICISKSDSTKDIVANTIVIDASSIVAMGF